MLSCVRFQTHLCQASPWRKHLFHPPTNMSASALVWGAYFRAHPESGGNRAYDSTHSQSLFLFKPGGHYMISATNLPSSCNEMYSPCSPRLGIVSKFSLGFFLGFSSEHKKTVATPEMSCYCVASAFTCCCPGIEQTLKGRVKGAAQCTSYHGVHCVKKAGCGEMCLGVWDHLIGCNRLHLWK